MLFRIVFILNLLQLINCFTTDVTIDIDQLGREKLFLLRDGERIQEVLLGTNLGGNIRKLRTENGFEFSGDSDKVSLNLIQLQSNYTIWRFSRKLDRNSDSSDCFSLGLDSTHWYGGPQQKRQYWPIEQLKLSDYSYVTKEPDNCGITERYWLNSKGVFIYLDQEIPLFIDSNTKLPGYVCFRGHLSSPYNTNVQDFHISYYLGIAPNAREAHMTAVKYFLNKPSGYPDERMVRHPIWSTWARYKVNINESTVQEFADEIIKYKFNNSQYEIDDDWEICYGALEFNTKKFPNIKQLTDSLKSKGFRVTLWIHPFINKGCEPWYSDAKKNGYLVFNHHNSTDTQWWNSVRSGASYIDFTKPAAAKWFSDRLKKIQTEAGIDSFKFDAGETSWAPADPILNGPLELHPSLITEEYIRTVAKFGPMVEVRSGQNTQDLPIFLRMIDKDSNWDFENGLATLITTMLQLNMVGYPLVLPDMIGGNGYEGAPSKELFIRWLAANVFMPSLQYSYVPWDYDAQTIEISLKLTKLHETFSDEIIKRMKLAVSNGDPINPPIWWIDPTDTIAQRTWDEYLLGENILVAPVVVQGAVTRDIYLPKGTWKDGNGNRTYVGPIQIKSYPAALDVIPYFIRQN